MLIRTQIAATAFLLVAAMGCKQGGDKESNPVGDSLSTPDSASAEITETEVQALDFVKTLPSPFHIATIYQRAGLKYISGLTNTSNNASKYISPYSKSVNLGVYSADLAYCSFNNQTQEAMKYSMAVKTLTDGLGLTAIFEETNLMPRFEKNIGNSDSMVKLMAVMHMESDILLKKTSRMDIAYLSFAGAWIESTYIVSQILKNRRNPEIMKKLVDQAHTLNKLILLLESHKSKQEFAGLITGLNDIKVSLDILKSENTTTHEEEFKKFTSKLEKERNAIVNVN
jgi:hypothetical protein